MDDLRGTPIPGTCISGTILDYFGWWSSMTRESILTKQYTGVTKGFEHCSVGQFFWDDRWSAMRIPHLPRGDRIQPGHPHVPYWLAGEMAIFDKPYLVDLYVLKTWLNIWSCGYIYQIWTSNLVDIICWIWFSLKIIGNPNSNELYIMYIYIYTHTIITIVFIVPFYCNGLFSNQAILGWPDP